MLSKKVLSNFIFRIVIQGLTFLPLIFIGRVCGPVVLGNITLALSFQNIFNSTISSSLGNAHLKLYNEDNTLELKTFLSLAFLFRVGIAIIIIGITMGSKLFNRPLFSDLQINLILIFLVQTVIGAITLTVGFIYVAKLQITKANMPFLIQTILVAVLQVVAVYMGYREYGISAFMMGGVLLSIIYVYILFRGEKLGQYDKKLAIKYVKITIGMLSGSLCYALLLGFDKVAIGAITRDGSVLGFYSAGDRLGTLFLALGTSLGGIFLSIFTKNKTDNKMDQNVKLLATYEKYLTVLVLPLFIGVMLFSKELLGIVFGPKYIVASLVLVFSMAHAFIKIQNIPLHNVYFTSDKFKSYNLINLLYSLAIITFTLVLGYINPLNSLIASFALGILLTGIFERGLLVFNLKSVDINFKFIYNQKALFFILIYFAIVGTLFYHFNLPLIFKLGYFVISFVVLHAGLYYFKIYTSDDLGTFVKLVKRTK